MIAADFLLQDFKLGRQIRLVRGERDDVIGFCPIGLVGKDGMHPLLGKAQYSIAADPAAASGHQDIMHRGGPVFRPP